MSLLDMDNSDTLKNSNSNSDLISSVSDSSSPTSPTSTTYSTTVLTPVASSLSSLKPEPHTISTPNKSKKS